MDKLEPILKQKFWILLGLVAPLSIFGYYSANGALKEATEKRIGELDGISTPSGSEANERWAEGLKVINDEYEKEVNAQIVRVWDEQKQRMVWPARMVHMVPETYRGEFTADGYGPIYSAEYGEQIRRLHASVEPVTMDTLGRITGNGKVLFNEEQIPRQRFTGLLSVPSEMIWDAQEDIWFLQLLLDAVRNVNAPYENAARSAVRAIKKIELWGGNGESSVKGSSGAIGGGMEMAGTEGMMGNYDGGMGEMAQGGGGMLGGGGPAVKVAFNPAEEFGTGGQPATMAGGAVGGMRGMMLGGDRGSMMAEAMTGANGEGMTGASAPAKLLRYVKEDASAPYRERGFYLSVLIDQRRVADFLVELSNSDWPIRLGRFHVGPNPDAGKAGGMYGGGMGGGMMGMMGAGYPGMESGYDAGTDMGIMGLEGEMSFAPGYGGEEGGFGPPSLNPTGESVQLLTHPDLVQLDLCGYITFFVPPPDDVLAAVQPSTTPATPATPTGESPPAADSATPAATPDASTSPDAGDAATPEGATVPGTTPAPADTTTAEPATEGAVEAVPEAGAPATTDGEPPSDPPQDPSTDKPTG